jgi:hypothetical protein
VPGGFNLVAVSTAQASSMAFVPAVGDQPSFGPATWYPIDVLGSAVCAGKCSVVTGNTVYQNQVMGLAKSATAQTYLATVSAP